MSTAEVRVVALRSPNWKEQSHFNLSIEIVPKKKADSVVKERQTEEYEVDDCIVPPMSPDIELPLDKDKKCQVRFAIAGGLKPAADVHDGEYMIVYSDEGKTDARKILFLIPNNVSDNASIVFKVGDTFKHEISIVDVPCQTETVSPGLVAVSISGGAISGASSNEPSNGKNMMFRYTVNNEIKAPYFNHSDDLFIVDKKPLVFYMNTACKKYPDEFTTYSATYFPKLGYFIDSTNGLAGDWGTDKSYWRILNFSQPLSVGVSSYVPRPGDNIVFNFTIYEKGNSTDHETTTETPSKMSSNPQVVTSTQKFRYTVCNDTMKTCCPPSVRLGIEDKQPLIYYMEKACDKYPKKFKKFTVSYKQSLNGYVVVAINEVIGNRDEKTIWRILNATGRVDLGASSYVPTPDDEITLRFENQDKSTPCPNNCNGCCHIL